MMKIDNLQVNKVSELYNKMKRERQTEKKTKDDKIDISGKAMDIKNIKKELDESAEIRSKKVEKLKTSIADGSYDVDSRKIAEKIIDNLGEK